MDETTTRFEPGADILHREIDALRAEVARLRRIEAVAVEFCARCERGEIRSTNTYVRFMTALRQTDSPLPEADLHGRPVPAPAAGPSRGA